MINYITMTQLFQGALMTVCRVAYDRESTKGYAALGSVISNGGVTVAVGEDVEGDVCTRDVTR